MQKKQEEEFKGPWLGGHDEVGNPIWVWKDPAKKKVPEVKKVDKKATKKKVKKKAKKR